MNATPDVKPAVVNFAEAAFRPMVGKRCTLKTSSGRTITGKVLPGRNMVSDNGCARFRLRARETWYLPLSEAPTRCAFTACSAAMSSKGPSSITAYRTTATKRCSGTWTTGRRCAPGVTPRASNGWRTRTRSRRMRVGIDGGTDGNSESSAVHRSRRTRESFPNDGGFPIMGARGPRSGKGLVVSPVSTLPARSPAQVGMTRAQAAIWAEIVSSRPADWFDAASRRYWRPIARPQRRAACWRGPLPASMSANSPRTPDRPPTGAWSPASGTGEAADRAGDGHAVIAACPTFSGRCRNGGPRGSRRVGAVGGGQVVTDGEQAIAWIEEHCHLPSGRPRGL